MKTTIGYGSAGVANNRLPVSISTGAGNGSLTATTALTYTPAGDVNTVDGPLSGTADTTKYRYDVARQNVGVIGPDPDAGGTLKHRAVRIAYNPDGQPSSVEQGTVNSQSDSDWTLFSQLNLRELKYDTVGRQVSENYRTGSAIHELTQYAYDAANRLDCATVRMN